ncbi:uncharacterized protein METZ01_LOCUS179913 [marine metagenome]|uniref:Uncharacterized protein n=1 Tax=marine metagenome TaxID=408172 RepID=A0A382CMF7_9ZZZZ
MMTDIFIGFLYIFHIKEKNSELLNWMLHNKLKID